MRGFLAKATAAALLSSVTFVFSAPTHAAAGRTDAAYGVTANGGATYSIPIHVTEGIRGLTPQLAITYAGPGQRSVLGVGFELSGLSFITPCRKTIVQDLNAAPIRLAAGDRFCLDGARLRSTSGSYGNAGTTYATEIDQQARVTSQDSVGGIPEWFEVRTGEGMIYEYGRSADSKLRSSAASGSPPQFWAINKVSDRSGNSITFHYDTDSAQRRFRPNYILYTASNAGAARYRISFIYQPSDRPDPMLEITPSLAGGAAHMETRLLQRVELLHDGQPYRKYTFGYESGAGDNQRLRTVQECALSFGEDCLGTTTFSWQSATAGFTGTYNAGTVGPGIVPLEINGDGFEDVAWPSGGTWWYMLGGVNGYGGAVNTNIAIGDVTKTMVLEWNGDGRDDLLIAAADGNWRVVQGSQSGLATTAVHAGVSGSAIPSSTANTTWTVADLDANGRDDLVIMPLNTPLTVWVRLNTPAGALPGWGATATAYTDPNVIRSQNVRLHRWNGVSIVRRPDFNGDGRTDLLVYACEWEVDEMSGHCAPNSSGWYQLISEGSTFVNRGRLQNATTTLDVRYADFNADGMTDAAFPVSACNCWYIGYGNGDGVLWFGTSPSYVGFTNTLTMTGDYDGDGYDDLYASRTGTAQWEVFRGKGTLGLSTTPIATGISSNGSAWVQTDANGDGLADIARIDASGVWGVYPHQGLPGERLVGATDGMQNQVSFQYLPMTNPEVYTKGTGGLFPTQDMQTGAPLVRRLTVSPAGASAFSTKYIYGGAQYHAQGRSFLGMKARTVTDERNGIYTDEIYKQEYPYTGALEDETVRQPGGDTIQWSHHTYLLHALNSTAGEERWQMYLRETQRREHEVGGSKNTREIRRTVATYSVNPLGNTTNIRIAISDRDGLSHDYGKEYVSDVTLGYEVDETSWCIAHPKSRTEMRTRPWDLQETRQVSWTVSVAECRVTDQTTEPGGESHESLYTDLSFDDCGNVNSITSYPVGQPQLARTTGVNYGTRCQSPVAITNARGESTTIDYNYALGTTSTITDPNGLTATITPDGFGRLSRMLAPESTATRVSWTTCDSGNNYCGKGNGAARIKITQTARDTNDAVLRTEEQYLDGLGRVRWAHVDSLESGASIVQTEYDVFGRVSGQSQPYFAGSTAYWTTYEYDLLGRVIEQDAPVNITQPTGRTTYIQYAGVDVSITDPRNAITTRSYTALGQLSAVTDPGAGIRNRYTYKPFGELESITDTSNRVSSWAYNKRGFLMQAVDAARGTSTYVPNAFGEIRSQINANGQTTSFTYDELSRPLTRDDNGTNFTTWTWGRLSDNTTSNKYVGRLKSVGNADYLEEYRYDSVGRLARQTISANGSSYPFDITYQPSTGLLETLQYPATPSGFRLLIAHDYAHNVLKRVRDANAATVFWEATSTDAFGHVQDEVFGNGVSAFINFDQASGRMAGREAGPNGSASLVNVTLGWDENGNLRQRQDLNRAITEDFEHDALNRLNYSTRNGVINQDVTIGASGDLEWRLDATPPRQSTTISYTPYDLPQVITMGTNSTQLSYGAWRNLYKQVSTGSIGNETTLYIGGLVEIVTRGGVTEYRHMIPGGSGTAAIHTRRTSGSPAAETFYVHTDHLGSPELITNDAGAARLWLSFGAFGERRDSTDWNGAPSSVDRTNIGNTTRMGFTGHAQLDSVNLIHMNGRVYDPLSGTFLSVDPLIRDLNSSQSLNEYAYVEGRPLSWIDPTGWGADDHDGIDFSCVPTPNSVVGFAYGMCGWHSGRTSGRRSREPSHGDGAIGLPVDAPYGRDWASLDSSVRRMRLDPCAMIGGGDGGTAARASCYAVNDPNISTETKLSVGFAGMVILTGGAIAVSSPLVASMFGLASAPNNLADGLPPFLPPFASGGKTLGIMRTAAGDVPLQSGWAGPASAVPRGTSGFDIVTRTHVEGHAAAIMRQQGVSEATLYINNPTICPSCTNLLPRMLPSDAQLTVITPSGSTTFVGFIRK
jgi:RHS repeat-associated protein